MNEYPQKLNDFLESMSYITDQSERINFLIEYAEKYKPVPESIAVRPFPQDHKAEFCESNVYVWAKPNNDGTFNFYFAVENPQGVSARALCAILDETLSGESPTEILKISTDIIFKIFGQNLSMGKNLGLTGILLMLQRDIKRQIA